MSRCENCKWYWCGAGFNYFCHEENGRRLGRHDEDGLCPWFEEALEKSNRDDVEDCYDLWNALWNEEY